VVFRGPLLGTQEYQFRNVEPTGKQVLLMVIGIMRVEEGLMIVEQWGGISESDLQQLLAL
jgi:hypothetical protein